MDILGLLRGRRPPRADRPNGLVGQDATLESGEPHRIPLERLQDGLKLTSNHLMGPPGIALFEQFPTQMMGVNPAASALSVLRPTSASVSPYSARRSECPTIT